jgi:hypothetical protein
MKWQPIETAPKDGRRVVLGWLPNGKLEMETVSFWRNDHWSGGWTPTHWRPTAEPETTTGLASQSGHWYRGDGSPCYEIRGVNGRLRPVTLADARKLQLYPSVTTVLACAARPALEAWKVRQAILSALTLPRLPEENLDAFSERAMQDSKEQARRAAAAGTEIHAAIDSAVTHGWFDPVFTYQVSPVLSWLQLQFPGVVWEAERSFACDMGYGGKIDLYSRRPPIVIDFKTKFFGADDDVQGYDDQGIQLAAYAHGIGLGVEETPQRWNLFISTKVPSLIVPWQWDAESYARHLEMFRHLLAYWQADKRYAPMTAVVA